MNLPNFLIVGAMKAGTTTLYDDLRQMPDVYMPPEKEPNDLADPAVETPEGLTSYSRKFRGAGGAVAIGEASTAYTKRPRFERSAERAVKILGPDLRIIYIMRDPIKRAVSQYHYELGTGLVSTGVNEALLTEPRFVDYSRYSYQLAPWQAVLPSEQILLIRFEDYMGERREVLRRVRAFLGLEGDFEVEGGHKNPSAGRPVVRRGSLWARITGSKLYLYGLKQFLPESLRDRIKATFLPKAPETIDALAPATASDLRARLAPADLELYERAWRPEVADAS